MLVVILLFLLLGNTPLPFRVKSFRRAPLLPCKVFDLTSQKQHHVRKGRLVWVRLEEMWHELLVSELGCGIVSTQTVHGGVRVRTISEQVVLKGRSESASATYSADIPLYIQSW